MHQNAVISFPSKRSVFNCLCNFDGIKDTKWKYLFMILKNSRVHVFYIIATDIANTCMSKERTYEYWPRGNIEYIHEYVLISCKT